MNTLHPDILTYILSFLNEFDTRIIKNNVKFNINLSTYAAQSEYRTILQWALLNRCPWDNISCKYALIYGYLEILQLMRVNEYSWYRDHIISYAHQYGHNHILAWMYIT